MADNVASHNVVSCHCTLCVNLRHAISREAVKSGMVLSVRNGVMRTNSR